MNRTVYLACPDPDFDDLKITAISLSKSMISNGIQTIPIDDSIIDGLANAYMKLCEHMKQHYFGLRDYYSLIKGIYEIWFIKKINNKIYMQLFDINYQLISMVLPMVQHLCGQLFVNICIKMIKLNNIHFQCLIN